MNFPVFGDAEGNNIRGQACAALIENGATFLSCPDRYPLAKIAYFALPYRLSKDPVTVEHLTLGIKLLVFLLFVVVAARILKVLSEIDGSFAITDRQFYVSATAIAVALLVVCINNIPIRLTDMEAACCAAIAVLFALTALRETTERNRIPYHPIFLTCVFGCLAGLFKQSFFVREALLMLAFACSLRFAAVMKFAKDWRVYAVIAAANIGFGAQLLYTWQHFGTFGLTMPATMEQVAVARQFPYVAMEIFTLPTNGAYMLSVQPETSWLSWYVHKIYYALVTNDPFVYGGYSKPGGSTIPASVGHWSLVYFTVILFAGLTIASIRYGSRAVRFLTLAAVFNIIFMTAYQHVEPRYHILPKALLVVLAVYWTVKAWNALPFARPKQRPSQAASLTRI